MKGVRIVGDGTILGTQVYDLENNLRRDDIASIFFVMDAAANRAFVTLLTIRADGQEIVTGSEVHESYKLELEIEDERS